MDEIVPVVPRRGKEEVTVDRDETVRATSMDKLAALKPSFTKDGVVTAGSSRSW